MNIAVSVAYFVLAGLAEIGGGYLVWLWLRDGRSVFFGVAGFAVLAAYGVIPTLQSAGFGRVYAASGAFRELRLARPLNPLTLTQPSAVAFTSIVCKWMHPDAHPRRRLRREY